MTSQLCILTLQYCEISIINVAGGVGATNTATTSDISVRWLYCMHLYSEQEINESCGAYSWNRRYYLFDESVITVCQFNVSAVLPKKIFKYKWSKVISFTNGCLYGSSISQSMILFYVNCRHQIHYHHWKFTRHKRSTRLGFMGQLNLWTSRPLWSVVQTSESFNQLFSHLQAVSNLISI